MYDHSVFKIAGIALMCGLIALTGCRHLPTQDHEGDEWYPGFVGVMGSGFYKLSALERRAFGSLHEGGYFDSLANSETNIDGYYSNIFIALAAPVVEPPEFWSRIVNDSGRNQLVRWHCLQALLLRHLELGDPVSKLRALVGSDDWFTEARFRSSGALNAIGVERRTGELTIVFTPDLQPAHELQKSARWIFLSVGSQNRGEEIMLEDILDELRGKRSKKRLVITQISIG